MFENKKGFTLIELLVVIAIIAILAAILFPVFIAAKDKGRQVDCASNMSQMGKALLMYMNDNDDTFPPVHAGWGESDWAKWSWYTIQPYIKNKKVVTKCPSAKYVKYPGWDDPKGAPNIYWDTSYGMNAMWRDPGAPTPPCTVVYSNGTATIAKMGMAWSTTKIVWAADYVVSVWSAAESTSDLDCRKPEVRQSLSISYHRWGARHSGMNNVLFLDGHVKLLDMRHLPVPQSYCLEFNPYRL